MSYAGPRTYQQKHVHNNQQTYIESIISKIVKNKYLWKTITVVRSNVNTHNNRAIYYRVRRPIGSLKYSLGKYTICQGKEFTEKVTWLEIVKYPQQ
jgi:hypothetical protein